MDYYKMKYLIITLFAIIILGCSSNDQENNKPLEITVSSFEPSYSQVNINWKITRPEGIIIQELTVYRQSKNDDTDFFQEKQIANLPSNEISFTDYDVPYQTEVSYKIKINYTDERTQPIRHLSLESEQKKFIREIVKFDRVPFQVQKDPLQVNVFHILDKEGVGYLKRYNSVENKLTDIKTFGNGNLLNNKFHIINDTEIYIADTQGTISRINANNYQTIATYATKITDKLNAFAISDNRIYYEDDDVWWYYTIATGLSTSTDMGLSRFNYAEVLADKNYLMLGSDPYGSGAVIFSFTPDNCVGSNCFLSYRLGTVNQHLAQNDIDPNIFSWNISKSKFITSINGCIFNISNLKKEQRLTDITGKHYFQFAFDNDNNIYATVQGEKVIHKFNSNYELIEVIKTKLYPFFPMVTSNGLKVIGGYEPVSYWSFEYGYSFNFNVKCAIETF
jgi:hypothetical protein